MMCVLRLLFLITPCVSSIFFRLVDRIDGVIVSLLVLSVVARGFEPRSGQSKDYKIGICYFSA